MMDILKSKESLMRWLLFAILFFGFLYINAPFITPLILAGLFAAGFQDSISKLHAVTGWKRKWWILICVAVGIMIFVIPLFLALYRIGSWVMTPENFQGQHLMTQLRLAKDFLIEGLGKISAWTGTDLATPAKGILESLLHRGGEIALAYSTSLAGELPAIAISVLVFLLGVTSMLFAAPQIHEVVLDYSFFDRELTENIIDVLKKSCSITLFSTFVIGLIQALVIGFGGLIFGEGDFWLVVAITFFVSFIPVIGAAPVGFVLAALAFFGERIGAGVGLTVVALFAGTIDNILKPFLVSGDFEIHPLMGFTSVVGAVIVLGLPGLLLGPVIMNLFVGVSPLLLKSQSQSDKSEE